MHLPDHFLSPVVSASAALVAAGGVTYSLHRARAAVTRERVVFASITTGFIFAAQMVNFAVLPGTSGHFMGGALAAALLGPWLGIVVVSAVLAVQALVFADGGLSALGANVFLMAVVGVAVATGLTALVRKVAGRPLPRVAAGLGAALSVPASALVFCALYAMGGAVPVPMNELMASMVGVHTLIGLGEAAITVAVLALVMALAPGLAFADARAYSPSTLIPAAAGLGVAAVLCGAVLSVVASSSPDGLESVAVAYNFADAAGTHALASAWFADYGAVSGIPVSVVGIVGAALAALVAAVVVLPLKRQSSLSPTR